MVYADSSTGRPWEGEMMAFVTWEAFLLLAGMLRVHLLLPIREFSEGWCQLPAAQCSAALHPPVRQFRWVPRSPGGSPCADLLGALLLERRRRWSRRPVPSLLARGWVTAWSEVLLCELGRVQSCELKTQTWSGSFCACLQQGDTDLVLKRGVLFSVSSLAGGFHTDRLHSSWLHF